MFDRFILTCAVEAIHVLSSLLGATRRLTPRVVYGLGQLPGGKNQLINVKGYKKFLIQEFFKKIYSMTAVKFRTNPDSVAATLDSLAGPPH